MASMTTKYRFHSVLFDSLGDLLFYARSICIFLLGLHFNFFQLIEGHNWESIFFFKGFKVTNRKDLILCILFGFSFTIPPYHYF